MSSHSSGGGSSTPPPSPPTTGSRGPKERLISGIKWMMFFTVIIIFGLGVSFSGGGLKIIGVVIAGIIALVVLLAIVGSGGGAGWGTVIISMVAASALFILWAENTKKVQRRNNAEQVEEQVILLPPPTPEPRQHFVVEAPVGREIRIPIPMGFTCDTGPVESGTNNVVWVRREGEERFKDWKGRPSGGARKSWSNYKYLESAGSVPVKVEVDIYPER